jgi:hypothetical protein
MEAALGVALAGRRSSGGDSGDGRWEKTWDGPRWAERLRNGPASENSNYRSSWAAKAIGLKLKMDCREIHFEFS